MPKLPTADAFHCPTKPEILAALFALLPRGRAWRTHEGAGPEPGSVLYQFWSAVAEVFAFVAKRFCDLRLEFWCATMSETRDAWMKEYGLPDDCDPWPDICAKVAAIGGQRCEYFAEIAARAGWAITCLDLSLACGTRVGCGRAGRARTGAKREIALEIIVDLGASPAYGGLVQTPPRAGRMRAGRPFPCPPNISPIQCIIERVAPAHVEVRYVTT